MPELSIIVPVYNVEKFLLRCLDSILVQTYSDFELILVDDGSPDNCPHICDEYARKDRRIIVIHQCNGGVSAARNAGLSVAKGGYIGFVDSDDSIEPTMYEDLITAMKQSNCDMGICGFRYLYEDGREGTRNYEGGQEILNNKELLKREFDIPSSIHRCICNKVIKRDIIGLKTFQIGLRMSEDTLFLHQCIVDSRQAVFVRRPLYNYMQRDGSVTHGGLNYENLQQSLGIQREIMGTVADIYPDLYSYAYAKYIDSCVWFYKSAYLNSHAISCFKKKEHVQLLRFLQKHIRHQMPKILTCKQIKMKQKFAYILSGFGIR